MTILVQLVGKEGDVDRWILRRVVYAQDSLNVRQYKVVVTHQYGNGVLVIPKFLNSDMVFANPIFHLQS